jgi:gliding motility-associated lipoprotein GldH
MPRLNVITLSFVAAVAVLALIVSCDRKRHFEEYKKIENNNWDYADPLVFLVGIKDTAARYNVYLNVRNAGFYGFSNLFLFINTHLPGGQVQRDTVECTLAASDGRWLGDGLGDIWDNRILFKENVAFPEPGEYRFELIQAMRVNPLPGIMDAGVRVEYAGD